MKDIKTVGQLKAAIGELVSYNWEDEEADFQAHAHKREVHIFHTMQALRRWISNGKGA